MFDKELYKKEVFEKCSNTKKDNFFTKDINFNKKFRFIPQLVAGILLFVGVGTLAYTGVVNNAKQKPEQNIAENQVYSNGTSDLDWANEFYYKKIKTLEEYNEFKTKYENIIEMTETDFENNFLLIVFPSGEVYISDIYSDDETLYVKLIRDFESDEENEIPDSKIISTKVSNNLDRDNIKIMEFSKNNDIGEGYATIEDLVTNGYTMEEAIEDGCIVTEYNPEKYGNYNIYLISNNQEKLDEFVEATKNGEQRALRLVYYNTNYTRYTDVTYKDGKYKVYEYMLVTGESPMWEIEDSTRYYEGIEMFKGKINKTEEFTYNIVTNRFNEEVFSSMSICNFNK